MLGRKVADANGPGPALLVQPLERQPHLPAVLGADAVWRVHQKQIHVPLRARVDLLDALQRPLVRLALAEPRVADLGRDEDVGARQAGLSQGGAHLGLVLVQLRRVDVSVACRERAQARRCGVRSVDLVYPEAEDRQPGVRVAQCDGGGQT